MILSQFKEINLRDYLPKEIIPKSGNNKLLEVTEEEDYLLLNSKRSRTVKLKKILCLTSDDFIAIGLYLAEGDKYVNSGRKYNYSGDISFINSERICIMHIIHFFEKFGILKSNLRFRLDINTKFSNNSENALNYWIETFGLNPLNKRPKCIFLTGKLLTRITKLSTQNGSFHIYYNSVIIRNVFLNFIYSIFDYCIKNCLKNELALILKGFFAGDGNVDYSCKYNRRQLEFTNHNLKLLEQLRVSLKIIGLNSIHETWPERTKTHSKALRIYNHHDFEILNTYDIPNLLDYKRKKFQMILDSY